MKVSKSYNFKLIRGELLKTMRKRRTQGRVSSLLGFSFNQVYRWESGLSQIKWADFVRYCQVCQIDLAKALAQALGYKGSLNRVDILIRQTIGKQQLVSLAKELGFSRFSLQDWVNGKADPPLDSLLKILQHFDALLFFVEKLVGPEMIPSLKAEHETKRRQLKLFYDHPICSAIMMCLRLKNYAELSKHQPGLIAKILGISTADENKYLKELKEAGAIEWSQHKYYIASEHFDARGDFEQEKRMRSFWMKRGLEIANRATAPSGRANFGFGIIPVSPEKEARIQEALSEFVSKAMAIAREPDENATKLRVLCMQLFDPGEGIF